MMTSLDHPNIIKMYDWFEYEGMLVIMLQYAQGTADLNSTIPYAVCCVLRMVILYYPLGADYSSTRS